MTDSVVHTHLDSRGRLTSPLKVAAHALSINAAAVATLASRIDDNFGDAVNLILRRNGRVVVSGMGKSGLVARKISATLASLGTPSFFVHSADAGHGDLGMITRDDSAVLISTSGETDEVLGLVPHLRLLDVPIIAITGRLHSTLGHQSDIVLDGSVEREACMHNLAPTTSTLVAMAIGDALAIALGEASAFQASDFAQYHPGGKLGRRLKTPVHKAMHNADLPLCSPDTPLKDMLSIMSDGQMGLVLVMSGQTLRGIITDGDLRRGLEKARELGKLQASDIMTTDPLTIGPDATLYEADIKMHEMRVTALVVTDPAKKVLGIVEIHD